jgi:uncharacterized paraquat-inducible protein A
VGIPVIILLPILVYKYFKRPHTNTKPDKKWLKIVYKWMIFRIYLLEIKWIDRTEMFGNEAKKYPCHILSRDNKSFG